MKLDCRLYDVALGAGVSEEYPLRVGVRDALEQWDWLSDAPGSFMALADGPSEVVRFTYRDADTITLEIPVPARRGSLRKVCSYDDCREVILAVFRGIDPVSLPGLSFQKGNRGLKRVKRRVKRGRS